MFLMMSLFVMVLCSAIILVFYLTNYNSYIDYSEKMTPFECGFDPLSKMRSPFSTRFFLLVVVFLIFDVEIALLFPLLTMLESGITIIASMAFITFLVILLFGMFHEWNEGALDWFSK